MKKVLLVLVSGLVWVSPVWAVRPLVVDDSGTVDRGAWEIEAGLELDKSRGGGEIANALGTSFKYGVLDKFDLGIELPWSLSSPAGLGDAALKAKYNVIDEFALRLDVKFANSGFGSGYTDYGLFAIYSKEMDKFSVHGNIGYTIVGKAEGSNSNTDEMFYGLAVIYPLGSGFTVMKEIYGTSVPSNTENPLNFQLAGNYEINKTAKIDLGFDFGLNSAASAVKGAVGLTLNL